MKISEKITAIRKALHLRKNQFADELHISASYVTEIESDKDNAKIPSDTLLDLIMRRWNVSVDWWETGEGEIFCQEGKKKSSHLYLEDLIPQLRDEEAAMLIRHIHNILDNRITGPSDDPLKPKE